MTISNNKHIITNDIVWIRQLLFSHVTFLSSNEVSVVFNSLSSHVNINLSKWLFPHEQVLIFTYSSILYTLSYSQSQVLGFHI